MAKANLFFKMTALLPLPFLALSPLLGGTWAFVALFYLSIFAFLADEVLVAKDDAARKPGWIDSVLADAVPSILGMAHLALLPVAVLTVANGTFGLGEKIVMFLAFGLFFGTIGTANAHELIHRSGWFRPSLGKWVFNSILFGHHVSAHLAVHHRYAATPLDPNSARLNQGFYRFLPQAWRGSFHAGLAAETDRLGLSGRRAIHPYNPYVIYFLAAAVFVALAYVLAGWAGVLIYFGYCAIAQTHLLLSDYVQHYGLERHVLSDGKYEPVSIHHSWNAPHVFSAALMLNAPKHSDHHAHPSRRYTELRNRTAEGVPLLPYSLPVMSCLALLPPIWKQVMNPRVADQQKQRDPDYARIEPTNLQNPV